MTHTTDEYTCDDCGCELTEDGNGQLFCPCCRFEYMLSMGELDEEIVSGEEWTRIGGVSFRLPPRDE